MEDIILYCNSFAKASDARLERRPVAAAAAERDGWQTAPA
jgi:hypothetical protein